ncbi:MAG: HYR domain-containing protein, partial [Verrucomicrobia bacterium]|nr:HYR domain-containing protein [Verrucomicrobiota bacterium]
YLVTWSVTNSQGRTGTATRTVHVVDTTPPVITVPANISVLATTSTGAPVTFATSATDNMDGPVATLNSPASGTVFPFGLTTVTVTASDGAGNEATRTFTVTVTVPPVAAAELVAPSLVLSGGNAVFTIKSSVPGRSYRIQSSADLTAGSWQNVGTEHIGDGNELVISVPRDPQVVRCFYRLALE